MISILTMMAIGIAVTVAAIIGGAI